MLLGPHPISKETSVPWDAVLYGRGSPSSGRRMPLSCLLFGDNKLQMLNWLLEFTACHFEPRPGWKVVGQAVTSSAFVCKALYVAITYLPLCLGP